jgi:hypothetical protein
MWVTSNGQEYGKSKPESGITVEDYTVSATVVAMHAIQVRKRVVTYSAPHWAAGKRKVFYQVLMNSMVMRFSRQRWHYDVGYGYTNRKSAEFGAKAVIEDITWRSQHRNYNLCRDYKCRLCRREHMNGMAVAAAIFSENKKNRV